jgi:hypothetical protein
VLELDPGPEPRQPEVEPADHDEQEREVRGAGDALPGRPAVSGHREVAVPRGGRAKKCAQRLRRLADNRARVGIDEERFIAVQRHGGGRGTVGPQRQAERGRPRLGFANARQQRLRRERLGVSRRRRRPGVAIDPFEHLLLVGQRHAGDGHDEDNHPGKGAGGEVHPEQNGAKCLHTAIILRPRLKFRTSLLPTKKVGQVQNEN